MSDMSDLTIDMSYLTFDNEAYRRLDMKSTALAPIASTAVSIEDSLQDAARAAENYAARSRAKNTRRAYESDFKHFATWCGSSGLQCLPAEPQTVCLYISSIAVEYKPSTLERRLSSISEVHANQNYESPCKHPAVKAVLKGIRNSAADAGRRTTQKAPALKDDITAMVKQLPDTLTGARDRALILVGFGAALRRSELVALTVEDITLNGDKGMTLNVRRGKTDQAGEGYLKAITCGKNKSTCAATAVRHWLNLSGITSGPLFRPINRHGQLRAQTPTSAANLTDHSVARIVKECAAGAGLDASKYSGHSLRAGLATSAALAGASALDIARQTGHQSLETVKRYVRVADVWRNNVTAMVGL